MAIAKKADTTATSAYDRDFYGWTVEQATALRTRRIDKLDLGHLAEEIEDLGKEQFNKLESSLRIILIHLLKWDRQPDRRTRSWAISIETHRLDYKYVLADNPGLKPRRNEALERAYKRARLDAALETGLPRSLFPDVCPYSLDDVLTRLIDWPDR
jgi:hypothetical protein